MAPDLPKKINLYLLFLLFTYVAVTCNSIIIFASIYMFTKKKKKINELDIVRESTLISRETLFFFGKYEFSYYKIDV